MAIKKKQPTTNEDIHAELKRLHLTVQMLTETLAKVHEEYKDRPIRKTFNLAGGKQTFWS